MKSPAHYEGGGAELRAWALLPSLKVQRAVIYLSGGRDWYRGAGFPVPAFAPAPRSAFSAGSFDGEAGKTAAHCLAYYVRNPCKGRRHVTAA